MIQKIILSILFGFLLSIHLYLPFLQDKNKSNEAQFRIKIIVNLSIIALGLSIFLFP